MRQHRRAAQRRAEDPRLCRDRPGTAATVNQLLDRYLDQFDGAPRTLELYRSYVRKHIHIGPLIGEVKVAKLDAEILDSF
jgi:integrase